MSAGWPSHAVNSQRLNRLLGQYASSPGDRAYCYSELVASSLAMTVTIDSIYCAYQQGDGQAELTWVVD